MKRAVLLDVSAIMYRAYFANINFRTKNEPTGAVYGFINTLLSIINEFKPDYMAAAFDVKRSSLKRTEIYGDYKSNRQSTPEDLVTQIPRIEEVLDAFNINRYKIDGYEADDVMATLATKFSEDTEEEIFEEEIGKLNLNIKYEAETPLQVIADFKKKALMLGLKERLL